MNQNLNAHIPTYEFYNSRKQPLTSIPTENDSWFNKGQECLMLEVAGATNISMQVKGCANICDEAGSRLSFADRPYSVVTVIDMSDYSLVSTITKNVLYAIGVEGIANITLDIAALAGNVTIVGCTASTHWGE